MESKRSKMQSLQLTPYTTRIDRSLLKDLVLMRHFEDIATDETVDTLTRADIKTYLLSLVKPKDQERDPKHLREGMAGCRFPASIGSPSARITTYCADLFE